MRILLILAGLTALAYAQRTTAPTEEEKKGAAWVRENYTKYEYLVPMRDGVRLFTSVYVPKDASQPWPIMFSRTPYSVGPYGVDNYRSALGPSDFFAKSKYIFVYQDVRGRYMSEGVYENMRPLLDTHSRNSRDIDESTDTWDTIDWLIKNVANNNGRVGMWGISYPGFYTACGMVDAHPALKAVSPQAPIADWFDLPQTVTCEAFPSRTTNFFHNSVTFAANKLRFTRFTSLVL